MGIKSSMARPALSSLSSFKCSKRVASRRIELPVWARTCLIVGSGNRPSLWLTNHLPPFVVRQPRQQLTDPRAGDDFIVLEGLKAGEQVVTSANFLIDSESQLQAAAGSFAPPPPGAGAAAAMNAPASAATIEFTTNPSPPHKGGNTFRVKLTGSDGTPVTGAQVMVTFFMPAMPAMGMAAMRTVSKLTDKGNGNYEGQGELRSGGTWQVRLLTVRIAAIPIAGM